jgi:hypothetical protein
MSYLTITDQERNENLAFNIVHREREFAQYQLNIDNYNHILSVLPEGDVPNDVAQYMDTSIDNLPEYISADLFKRIMDYQYRRNIQRLIRSETTEQNKSKHILEALKIQIPADQLQPLVEAALDKINNPQQLNPNPA